MTLHLQIFSNNEVHQNNVHLSRGSYNEVSDNIIIMKPQKRNGSTKVDRYAFQIIEVRCVIISVVELNYCLKLALLNTVQDISIGYALGL